MVERLYGDQAQIIPATNGEVVVYNGRTNFTEAQKKWVRERDASQCRHPERHDCRGQLEVHHVLPQMYAQVAYHEPPERINTGENGITLCQNVHRGQDPHVPAEPVMVHPDQFNALRDYAHNPHSFKDVAKKHFNLARQGFHYWMDRYDPQMSEYAQFMTRYHAKSKREYPLAPKKI